MYNKEFKKITIQYIDYLNSKVCASEFVDYKTQTIKPNENGEVEVKYRMKRKMVKADEIDLIDLHPDYRLSSTTRRIPFINSTDSEDSNGVYKYFKLLEGLKSNQHLVNDTSPTTI